MDTDLALVVGLVIGAFAIPSVVSALSDRRTPRVAAIVLILGGGLIAWAVSEKPGGYRVDQVPDVFVKVVARFI